MLTAPPLVVARGFSALNSIEFVDLDLGLPTGVACSRLCAWDGIPLIPPPMGPALARSKVIGGIPDELQPELRDDEEAMCENMRFATSDFELRLLCRFLLLSCLIAGPGVACLMRFSSSEFECECSESREEVPGFAELVTEEEFRFGAVVAVPSEIAGWLSVGTSCCVPVTFAML